MLRRERTPGPGAYNNDTRPLSPSPPAYTMSQRTPNPMDMELPGPSTYSPKIQKNGPSYSLGFRHPFLDREKMNMPGPGTYAQDTPLTHFKEPSYTMGSKKFHYDHDASPGPGAYIVQASSQGPQYTMLGKKTGAHGDEIPGPGSYNMDTHRPTSPSYTIGNRVHKLYPDTTPGPGTYRLLEGRNGPAYSMSSRRPLRIPHGPGPGQYEIDQASALAYPKEPSFTMALRRQSRVGNGVPGPGTYSPAINLQSPSYSIGGKRFSSYLTKTPGPGAYDVAEKPVDAPAFTMGGKTVKARFLSLPGPGAYNPKVKSDSPSYSILNKRMDISGSKTPGPGEYDIDGHTVEKTPAFSIGRKFESRFDTKSPGPGSYKAVLPSGGPKFSMGSGTQRFAYMY